jgi:hypothetical protein
VTCREERDSASLAPGRAKRRSPAVQLLPALAEDRDMDRDMDREEGG